MSVLGSRTGHEARLQPGAPPDQRADQRMVGRRVPLAVAVAAVAVALAVSAGATLLDADTMTKLPPHKRPAAPTTVKSFVAMIDVAEAEPNGRADQAQPVGCGNSLRPASLFNAAAPDTDWISLTASAGDVITVETADDGFGLETDTVISLIASDGSTILATNDDAHGATYYSRIEDFPATYSGFYYVRIRGFSGAEGPYRANVLCTPPPAPPANDRCAGAIDLGCGSFAVAGTTASALNDYELCPGEDCTASCTGFPTPGRDVVYRLDAHEGDVLDATYQLDPAETDASLYLVTDCSNVVESCVAGHDSNIGIPAEHLVHVFTQTGTYYLILDAFSSGGATFTLNGELDCGATPTERTTWGRLKTIYR